MIASHSRPHGRDASFTTSRSPSLDPPARAHTPAMPHGASGSSTTRLLVATFGNGQHGRLGHGSQASEVFPRAVAALARRAGDVVAVACGGAHTACVTADGALWTFGMNDRGQLGHSGERGWVAVSVSFHEVAADPLSPPPARARSRPPPPAHHTKTGTHRSHPPRAHRRRRCRREPHARAHVRRRGVGSRLQRRRPAWPRRARVGRARGNAALAQRGFPPGARFVWRRGGWLSAPPSPARRRCGRRV